MLIHTVALGAAVLLIATFNLVSVVRGPLHRAGRRGAPMRAGRR